MTPDLIPALKYLAEKYPERFTLYDDTIKIRYYGERLVAYMWINKIDQDDADEILAALPEPRHYLLTRYEPGLIVKMFDKDWLYVGSIETENKSKRDAAHAAIVAAVEEIKKPHQSLDAWIK